MTLVCYHSILLCLQAMWVWGLLQHSLYPRRPFTFSQVLKTNSFSIPTPPSTHLGGVSPFVSFRLFQGRIFLGMKTLVYSAPCSLLDHSPQPLTCFHTPSLGLTYIYTDKHSVIIRDPSGGHFAGHPALTAQPANSGPISPLFTGLQEEGNFRKLWDKTLPTHLVNAHGIWLHLGLWVIIAAGLTVWVGVCVGVGQRCWGDKRAHHRTALLGLR